MFSCINDDSIECPSSYDFDIDNIRNTIGDIPNTRHTIDNINYHIDKSNFIIILEYVYQEKIDDVQLVFEEIRDNSKNNEPVPHIKVNI